MVVPRFLVLAAAFPVGSAVPLPFAGSWDRGGIGGALVAGPVWKSDEGIAPNHLSGFGWFHYRPDLVAGLGLSMTDWNDSRSEAYFQTQYLGALSWIPWGDSSHLLEVALRLGGQRSQTTLDTFSRPGPLPLVDNSWDWQIGLRVGGGWNMGRWGVSVSTGPLASWRSSGAASGWSMTQESELGLQLGLQDFWNDAKSYTRAWSIAVRVPVQYQPSAPRFTRQGVERRSQWSFGLLVGPTVLF